MMRRFGSPNDGSNVFSRPGRSGGKEVPPPPQLTGSGPMTFGRGGSIKNAAIGRNAKGYSLMEHNDFLATAVAASNSMSVMPSKKKKDYFDEDSDEDLPYQPAPDSPTICGSSSQQINDDDDEEDTLDAFMSEISNQVKRQLVEDEKKVKGLTSQDTTTTAPTLGQQQQQPIRTDIDDEDAEESYYRYMQENPTAGLAPGEELPDIEYDEDGNPIIEKKKHIDPLPPIDHKQIDYPSFNRFFYNEHPEISALSNTAAKNLRFKLGINASGTFVPNPVCSFAHFGFDETLMHVIRKSDYTRPTPIQAQAIPVALSGRDLIGIAKTGSGKTAAYLWPMIVHIMDQPTLKKDDGPIGLICAPTRELSLQIYSEAKKFSKAYGLKIVCAYGGGNKYEQCKALNEGAEIVVCTPGRLIDCIKAGATNLQRVTFVVFDEADRMFDLGFGPQVRSIANHIRPDRQSLMFSATFKPKVEKLAKIVLTNPVRIVQGEVGDANEDVTQYVKIFGSKEEKLKWLTSCVVSFLANGQVLVFSTRKADAEELAAVLKRRDFDCVLLHGDMHQYDRTEMITKFKQGQCRLMVATDVAARGLDIPTIKTVVNYDPARDIDTHVHRVGRTGRAGEKGDAFTLLQKPQDAFFASQLVQSLEASHQIVSPELLELAMVSSKFKKPSSDGGFNSTNEKPHVGLGYCAPKSASRFSQSSTENTVAAARASLNISGGFDEPVGVLGSKAQGGPQSGRLAMMKAQFNKQFMSSFTSASSKETESTSTLEENAPNNSSHTSAPHKSSKHNKRESRWGKEKPSNRGDGESSKHASASGYSHKSASTQEPRAFVSSSMNDYSTSQPPSQVKFSSLVNDDAKFKVPALPAPSMIPAHTQPSAESGKEGTESLSGLNEPQPTPPKKKKSRWDVT